MDLKAIIAGLLGIEPPEGEGLEGFSAEQLTEANEKAMASFSAAKESRDLTAGREATDTIKAISSELADREKVEAEVDAEFATLEAEVTPVEASDEDNADADTDADADADADAEVAPEVVAEPEVVVETPAPEAVAADAAPAPEVPAPVVATPAPAAPAPVTPIRSRSIPRPTAKPKNTGPLVTITAAADVAGHSAGTSMKAEDIGAAFVSKASAARKGRVTSRMDVATIEVEYPESRNLDTDDSISTNTAKIMNLIASAQKETAANLAALLASSDGAEIAALTAAGGLCAPVNVRYEIFQLGTDRRPLRDGLLRFGATRGGIRYNAPPVLADVAGSVNIYSEAQDASGADYPKGCIRVDCGDEIEVKVAAIPLCMQVGNFQKLSFPENFQAWWKLGHVLHSRTAEDFLWDQMSTLSILADAGNLGGELGAARDVLAFIARAAEQYRDRFRIDPETPLRVYAPTWLVTMMQVDLLRQSPGDDTIGLARTVITRYFAAFNIATTFILDGQPAGGTSGYVQVAGDLNPWPKEADVILCAEGTFVHLDMGTLDFGTEIRDFTQIRQNDSGAFMETFEEIARVGPQAIKLRMQVCPSGVSQAPDQVDVCTPGS